MDANRAMIPVDNQFKIMADTAPVLMWISGVDKLCYFFNAGWLKFTGRTMDEECGSGWLEGVHPEDLQHCLHVYNTSFDARKEFKMEYRLKRHDGQYRWLLDGGVPRYNADGVFVGYIGSCMDIDEIFESERVRAAYISAEALTKEKALNEELAVINEEIAAINDELGVINEEQNATNEELTVINDDLKRSREDLDPDVTDLYLAKQKVEQNEKNLYNMILQAPVAMCILLGEDYRITVANQLMLELWGKPANQVINQPLFEAMKDVREQGLEEVISKAYHEGKSYKASERAVSLLRNGQYDIVYQNFVFEPYRDTDGTILGVIAITIDVTEQVLTRQQVERNEAELIETKKQLEAELEVGRQLQRKKDDFIGIASHELKTPLTTLTAIVQVLERKLKDSEDPFIIGAMDKAGAQVRKMITLIHGFLNISRLESGKMLIDKRKFQLDRMLHDLVEEAQLTAHDHVIQLSGCEEIEVFADPDKITSVISNLLSNAVKYSPRGENIGVHCDLRGNFVQISVQDEGMGIKEQDKAKLFDRYYRVESDHTRHISGFGIGLYLSAEIIEHHGGKIWVESESGKGSTFYFTLPL